MAFGRKKKQKEMTPEVPADQAQAGNGESGQMQADETPHAFEPQEDSRIMKFIYGILHHRRAVIIVFSIFSILCALCIPLVNVNYNLASYLPEESNSTKAIDLMEEVYGTEIPNARLYAQGVSLTEAAKLADALEQIDGVDDVLWLGTQVDTIQPLEVADSSTVDSWMTEEGFLYQLTIDGDKASTALEQARAQAYENGANDVALSGDSVTTVTMQESTATEILYIMLLAVIIIIVIISLTSESWFEWVIFLTVLAMAIMMNMGTNVIRGEISFITQICAAVLQLAVSMDYAIVMLHTFRRYQGEYPDDPVRAMAHAMHKGFSVVLSSAAVTFFGFLSLSVMSFLIGVDMGIVLAKGIFFSFLAVMFLMPCIILACLKPLKRFEHRPLLPSFDRFGVWCTRLMIPLSIVVVIIAVPSVLGQSQTTFTYGTSGMAEEGSQLGDEARVIDDAFKASETWVMMVPQGQWADEKALVSDLEALPAVDNVVSYTNVVSEKIPTEMVPEAQLSQLLAEGYSRIVIQTTLDANSGTDYDMVEEVRAIGSTYYGDEVYLAGTQVSEYDLKVVTSEDSMRVKFFSIGAIALVLMLMFRSLSIPLIVLLPIEISIWINLGVPYFTGQSINYIGYLVIDAVQLGASVDYAIIYTREYLEQRGKYPAFKAAQVAISKSAITIMTSALILTIAGLTIYFIASNGIISEIGMLVGRGAFISMLMMFTLLPLLFVLCDWIIRHTSIGLKFFKSEKRSSGKQLKTRFEAPAKMQDKGQVKVFGRHLKRHESVFQVARKSKATNLQEEIMPVTTEEKVQMTEAIMNKSENKSMSKNRNKSVAKEKALSTRAAKEKVFSRRMGSATLGVFLSLALVAGITPAVEMNAYAESGSSSADVQTTNNSVQNASGTNGADDSEGSISSGSSSATGTNSTGLATDGTNSTAAGAQEEGLTKGKEEVIYTKLAGDGSVAGIYVVNGFHFEEETKLDDPGTYTEVTNLSTTDVLENKNGKTSISAPAGEFFYQGVLDEKTELPWDVSIEYRLDGKKLDAADLAGMSGNLEISLTVVPTDLEDSIFVDNYLLQASASFADDTASNLEADGGSVAASGASHQVTFMVLPGGEGNFSISARISDFAFGGFTIVAVPLSLALDVDSLDTDELSASMDDLKDAVAQIDDGAGQLQAGTNEVASGISQLAALNFTLGSGSSEVANGISQLSSGASSLSEGSSIYVAAIQAQASDAASKAGTALSQASAKQQDYVNAMMNAQSGLASAGDNLSAAYTAVATAMQTGDTADLGAALSALSALEGDLQTVGGSLASVSKAIGDESTPGLVAYQAEAAAYSAAGTACSELGAAYTDIDDGVQQLANNTSLLNASYAKFDEGLGSYLGGVTSLNKSYGAFQSGMETYKEGTAEFADQVSTIDQDLLDAVKDELDNYLSSDYELHSFVDSSNTAVSKVQFIFMTDAIELPEEEPQEVEEPEEETAWTRLLALFE